MPIEFETDDAILIDKVNKFVDDWNSDSDQIVVQTSGSTGDPKSIPLLKKHMIASAMATGNFLELKHGDNALLCLSPETVGGKMMIARSLVLGLNLTVVTINSDPLENLSKRIDFAAMVPLQVQKSLVSNPEKINGIGQLIIGGAPISETLLEQLQGKKCKMYHTFGMTETISHIAMRSLNAPLTSHFMLLPAIKIHTNEDSCLVVDAPLLGVKNLETNDIVEIIDSTSFRWLGRKDFVINSGGIKLHPEEIEAQLSKHIHTPFFVRGQEDDILGERLVLHIEQNAPISMVKSDFISILGNHQIPKEVYYHSTFRLTRSGKIDRLATIIDSKNVTREVL